MRKPDREGFARCIATLCETFQREASAATIEAYWLGLEDLTLEAVEHGARRALRECEFMPAPARLRALSGMTTTADRAELAWERVLFAIRSAGGWESVDFEDPAINAAVRGIGGWVSLTVLPGNELHAFARQKFLESYKAWAGRGSSDATAGLAGMFQMQSKGRFKVHAIPCEYLPADERRELDDSGGYVPLGYDDDVDLLEYGRPA